jgi:DNA mismatch repair protein MutH
MDAHQFTEEEIVSIGKSTIGKTFDDLGFQEWAKENNGGKGRLGEFFEECVYGYKKNSDHHADFTAAGIELKVTGCRFKNEKDIWTAKERLVLCMINYLDDYQFSFEDSPMWEKSKKIFAIFYRYSNESKEDYGKFRIIDARLLSFSDEDIEVIKEDYNKIIEKIKGGTADTISEGDTNYLAACTKGATADSSWTDQPFAKEQAKRRAWSYKPSFMSRKINEWFGQQKPESIITDPKDIERYTLEGAIMKKVDEYIGMKRSELVVRFGLPAKQKQLNRSLLNKMLGLTGDEGNINEISAADIIIKTVTLEPDGLPQEHMSFPYFDFSEVANTPYEDSEIYKLWSGHTFLFVLWKKAAKGKNQEETFAGICFWKMAYSDLMGPCKKMYEETAKMLREGTVLYYDDKHRIRNHFPKPGSNGVCHVRPHGRDGQDTCRFPVQDKATGLYQTTKQGFWLDRDYVRFAIKK